MQQFSGLEYLMIDIANQFGLDKRDWDDRLNWFYLHEGLLEDFVNQAEEPALYFAAVQAYRTTQRGEPTGYPISLDATSSGLQPLAVLTGDRSAAMLCNVVDTGHRRDAYSDVFEIMVERLTDRLGPEASGKIDRSDLKSAIMTSLYGSTAIPKKVFGPGPQLAAFYEVMNELAPAAWELNEAFLKMWDSEASSNDWVLPDNFHVHVKVMAESIETVNFLNEPEDIVRFVNAPTREGRSLSANTVHSLDGMIVREMTRRCDYDRSQVMAVRMALTAEVISSGLSNNADDQMVATLWGHYENSGYLSARIMDLITPSNVHMVDKPAVLALIDSLPKKPFKVLTCHDCFRCLANYGKDLRQQYVLQLHLIAKSNLLSFLLSQLMKRDVKIGPLDPTLADDILQAEYALS